MPVLKTYRLADTQWHETSATSDADAIHDNVAGEIDAIAEKASPVGADVLVIEDSEDSEDKKKVQIGNLPGGGGAVDSVFGRTGAVVAVEGDYDIDELGDVDTTTDVPVLNEVLKWNNTDWVPGFAVASFPLAYDATGGGTISSKGYLGSPATTPANKVLTSFESDDDSITVRAEIHVEGELWQPTSASLNFDDVTKVTVDRDAWTQVDHRHFTADLTWAAATTSGTLNVVTSDGGESPDIAYTRALDPPLVLTGVFDTHPDTTGGSPLCPFLQTQVKSGDTVRITGTTESHADEVYVKDAGVSSTLQGPFTVTAGAFDFTCTVGSRSSATQTATLYAKVTGGSAGADFGTTNTIDQDQTSPTFGAFSVAYPGAQEAFKAAETVSVTLAHTNIEAGDTYLYSDPTTTDVTIPSTTTYASPKTGVTINTAGIYRHDGSPANFKLQVTRTEKNGKVGSSQDTIEIADVAAVVTIGSDTGGSALPRMGTDDGTLNYGEDEVFVVGNQKHLSTSTSSVVTDAGDSSTFQGAWTADGTSAFKRTLRVADGDISAGGQASNNYTWGACSVTNRAGTETTSVTTNTTYQLGGFATRTINMGPITGGDPPYTHTGDVGCPVVDTSKTTVVNTSKGGTPSQTYEGNVTEHNNADSSLNNYWTTVAALASESFDDYTKFFHCSDKKFYDSVTAPGGFNVTIAESA